MYKLILKSQNNIRSVGFKYLDETENNTNEIPDDPFNPGDSNSRMDFVSN